MQEWQKPSTPELRLREMLERWIGMKVRLKVIWHVRKLCRCLQKQTRLSGHDSWQVEPRLWQTLVPCFLSHSRTSTTSLWQLVLNHNAWARDTLMFCTFTSHGRGNSRGFGQYCTIIGYFLKKYYHLKKLDILFCVPFF